MPKPGPVEVGQVCSAASPAVTLVTMERIGAASAMSVSAGELRFQRHDAPGILFPPVLSQICDSTKKFL